MSTVPNTAAGTQCQPCATLVLVAGLLLRPPTPRAEEKLHQMLQKGARKGQFRLRVPAAAEGNWQPAGDGLELAAEEGTGEDRSREGPGGTDGDAVALGGVRGTGLVPEPKQGKKKRKYKSEPAKGLCKATGWVPGPFPGLGDMVQGSGDPG